MIFRRKRNAADESEAVSAAAEDSEETTDDELDPRADGPFDITEVDLDADDELPRIDLGAILVTGFPELELQLQVAEGSQQVVAAVLVSPESALELAAFAAPRSGGLWAELQTEYLNATAEAGGRGELRDGPFGLELHRVVPVEFPDGRRGEQETRTWMAEGPRWLVRGILHGAAARIEGTEGPAAPFYEAYRTVVVRRGDAAMGPGDPLPLQLPADITPS